MRQITTEIKPNNIQTNGTGALKPQPCISTPGRITKKIGSTTYNVAMYYSKTSRENLSDKIIRPIKNEALNPQ